MVMKVLCDNLNNSKNKLCFLFVCSSILRGWILCFGGVFRYNVCVNFNKCVKFRRGFIVRRGIVIILKIIIK